MNSIHQEQHSHIPVHTTATLIKASIIALLVAIVVLLVAILPAEYNIDPTGLGKVAGLTQLAQAEEQPATASQVDKPAALASTLVQSPTASTKLMANEEAPLLFAKPATHLADAPSVADIKAARQTTGVRTDTVNITIAAGKGLEYKLLMDAGMHLTYQWRSDSAALYFDFHGEPQGDKTGYYESFSLTTAKEMKGSLTTPFAGSHGWYWKNKTDKAVVVTLTTTGDYRVKG
ncbi:hypothetical protein [Shewanella waksmanii]|uniref:hypothetical protein n=1 Tax=Shewanella waksmanii TaxID=213783 RepID=UPI0004BCA161|nr:hypothetical protein [Shewanella waksmanii]